MARKPRLFIHNRVYDICFSTEEGLPLIATAYMRVLLRGILAHASRHHPVTLCHFIVMGNHIHLLIRVQDPESVHKFIAYVKRESAAAINRLLGRQQHTVWKPGYDAPLVLDTAKMVERIVYYYLNPVKANLVGSIESYPQLSSWEAFCSGGEVSLAKRIPRDEIQKLPDRALSLEEQELYAARLVEVATEEAELRIEPDAWIDCMIDPQDARLIRAEIVKRVRAGEEYYAKRREIPVLGALLLTLQDIRMPFAPKRSGRKTLCLTSFKELRKQVIEWKMSYFDNWKKLQTTLGSIEQLQQLPAGLFAPGGRMRANLLPQLLPF